jgi:hypothetical protein
MRVAVVDNANPSDDRRLPLRTSATRIVGRNKETLDTAATMLDSTGAPYGAPIHAAGTAQ